MAQKTRNSVSNMDPWPAAALAAVLDMGGPEVAGELPPLWHWLYFLEAAPHATIGPDGHPQTGGFMPQVEQPRRMFAGGRSEFLAPLQLGRRAELSESVIKVEPKSGRSGSMTLVTVELLYHQGGTLCVREERDFIYLPARNGEAPAALAAAGLAEIPGGDWDCELQADEARLMRFSALTFNSHRIHYDRRYAREQEAYPDLVVHGPFTALCLLELLRRSCLGGISAFEFRGLQPLFVHQTIRLRGNALADNGVELLAYTPSGERAMSARAQLRNGERL